MKCNCPISSIEQRVKTYKTMMAQVKDSDTKSLTRQNLNEEKQWQSYTLLWHKIVCLGQLHLMPILQ